MSQPGTSLYVNADWSALVPMDSPEAAFGIAPEDARRLGLLPKEPDEVFVEPEKLASANLLPEPEAEPEAEPHPDPEEKQAPTPANKAARKRRNK